MTDNTVENPYQKIVNDLNTLFERLPDDLPSPLDDATFQQLPRRKLQRLQGTIQKHRAALTSVYGGEVLAWLQDVEKAVDAKLEQMDEDDKPLRSLYKRACEVYELFPSHMEKAKKSPYFAWMEGTLNDIKSALGAWEKLANSDEAPRYDDPRVQAQAKVVVDLWAKYCPDAGSKRPREEQDEEEEEEDAGSVLDMTHEDEEEEEKPQVVVVKREKVSSTAAANDNDDTEDDDGDSGKVASSSSAAASVASTSVQPSPQTAAPAAKKSVARKDPSYANKRWLEAWRAYRASLAEDNDLRPVVKSLICKIKERKNRKRSVRSERESLKEICATYAIDWDTVSYIFKDTITPAVVNAEAGDGSSSG